MAWGRSEEHLRKAQASGQKIAALDSKVEVHADLVPVWSAFWELHGARSGSGFGPNPIAPADAVAYAGLHVDGVRERREWVALILAMDRAWFRCVAEAEDRPKGKATGKEK